MPALQLLLSSGKSERYLALFLAASVQVVAKSLFIQRWHGLAI